MTILIADIASYQGALTLSALGKAGFSGINLKVSHGLGVKSVHPDVRAYVAEAKSRRWKISTFHYLTADAAGWAQAEHAYDRLSALGLLYGTAHQLDVESDPAPSLTQVRTYLETMQAMLGRPVVLYTGDWWWASRPKWNVSDLTPYLWAAPNRGYVTRYPGDTHTDWLAGYGGWAQLSVMQYAVEPVAGIRVSMSAIRDADVWTALTQGRQGMSYAPDTLKTARRLWLDTFPRMDPLSMGIVGDDAHARSGNSYHLGKDANRADSYSIAESSRDRNPTDAAMALDIGWFEVTVGGKTHNLRTFSAWLVAECRAGADDAADIREVIYSTDGDTVRRWDKLGKRSTGDKSHLSHTHVSYFRDSEKRDKTTLYLRYFTEIGLIEGDDDMATISQTDFNARMDAWWKDRMTPPAAGTVVSGLSPLGLLRRAAWNLPVSADGKTMYQVIMAILELAEAEAAEVPPSVQELVAGVRAAVAAEESTPEQTAELLRGLLGERAAAVGRLLSAGA